MQRVLVTGCSGLLGRYVVEELRGTHIVRGLDLSPPALEIPYTLGSVADKQALQRAMEGVDVVVHLAAMANLYAGSAEKIMSVNTLGTWQVMQAAESAGVRRVILCSSDSATGLTLLPELMRMPRYLPVDEYHPCHPMDPYGLSKKLGESIGESFAARGHTEVIVLRPVYILYSFVHEEVLRRARDPENYIPSPEPGVARAGGGPFWHYVRPEDVAHAFRQAVELKDATFETFFVSAQETLSPVPTLERVAQLWGELPEIRRPSFYEDNPFAPLFDTTHAKDVLGFCGNGAGVRSTFVRA